MIPDLGIYSVQPISCASCGVWRVVFFCGCHAILVQLGNENYIGATGFCDAHVFPCISRMLWRDLR